mmetsp:Transcript_55827/g.88475  ORF Transcript_55827/g.88475 Transcript_55827/m.88475 type:complete len:204 (+) Transcript_55827:125-736(+)
MPKVRKNRTKSKAPKAGASDKKDDGGGEGDDTEEKTDAPAVLSRGQRKRQKRRGEFVKKFDFVTAVSKTLEARQDGALGDLGGLGDTLDEALLNQKAPPATSKNRKGRKALAVSGEQEMAQYRGVLGFKAFQLDPLGAMEQHLKNSIKRQKQDAANAKSARSRDRRQDLRISSLAWKNKAPVTNAATLGVKKKTKVKGKRAKA